MKVTEGEIQRSIKQVEYVVRGTMTVCFIDLKNGFTVIGESACVDPREFDAAVGRSLAYSRAFSKLWSFFGFNLAQSSEAVGARVPPELRAGVDDDPNTYAAKLAAA